MKLISKALFICMLPLFLGGNTQVIQPVTDTTAATVDSLKSAAQSFVDRVNAVEARAESLKPAVVAERITTNEIKAWIKHIRRGTVKTTVPDKPKSTTPNKPIEHTKTDTIIRTIYKAPPIYGGTPWRDLTEKEKAAFAGPWRRWFPKKRK